MPEGFGVRDAFLSSNMPRKHEPGTHRVNEICTDFDRHHDLLLV